MFTNRWLALLLPIAGALVVITGCPLLGDITTQDDDTFVGDNNDDDTTTVSFKATIETGAPVPADFWLNGDLADECMNVKSCKVEVIEADEYTVIPKVDGFLFPEKTAPINQNGDLIKLDWNCNGCWGIELGATYKDESGTYDVESFIENGVVLIYLDFAFPGISMTGYTFDGKNEIDWRLAGSISGDLNTISYTIYDDTEKIHESGSLEI